MTPDDPRHGTERGYYAHHRANEKACPNCQRAMATASARRVYAKHIGRPASTPPDSPGRRIQALIALGHTYHTIADDAGVHKKQVRWIALGQKVLVHRATLDRITAAYERLSMTLPPETTKDERISASKSRNRARRMGWLPPLAWEDIDAGILATPDDHDADEIDHAVIARILAGDTTLAPYATRAEREEVIRRWENAGHTQQLLEELTGWTVNRRRRRAA